MKTTRKQKNIKRKQTQKNIIDPIARSTLHLIDEMQTFYIKNWDTEDHNDQQVFNPQNGASPQKNLINQKFSSEIKKTVCSSSLPRLKPLGLSHDKLKLVWKQKQHKITKSVLPQLNQAAQCHSFKLKPIDSSSLQKGYGTDRKKILPHPRNRTQTDSKLEVKFHEYKFDGKQSSIAQIFNKHKSNYKSQIIHHYSKDQPKQNLQSKIIKFHASKFSEKKLISQSLKYYLNAGKINLCF